jgi:hypothetical protein
MLNIFLASILDAGWDWAHKATMRRRATLFAFLMIAASCATTPPDPVVWYVISPIPTQDFPHGNINSPISRWEKLRNFPSADECRNALRGIRNEIHRPANCVPSNDPRLM